MTMVRVLAAALLLTACPEAQTMLVLAPRAFAEACAPYVAARNADLPCRLLVLEDVLAGSPGADDPERLKRRLYRAWLAANLRYVLLVGDGDVLPVRYMILDRNTKEAFDHAFYPSDLYYADVARRDGSFEDWNGNLEGHRAGYFGEVRGEHHKDGPINADGIDYRPELAVGRWPVSTLAELEVVIRKSLRHQDAAPVAPRAGLIAVDGWVDSRPVLDAAAAALGPRWTIERRYFDRPDLPAPTTASVTALWNEGPALLLHAGHGQPDAWDQCLPPKAARELRNERLPMVLSVGCSTACFAPCPPYEGYVDVHGKVHAGTNHGEVFAAPPPQPACLQEGPHDRTGLGEILLLSEQGGAWAYIGCNTGSQPCALTLLAEFAAAAGRAEAPRLGDCWVAAVRGYHARERLAELRPTASWYPPSIFFQAMKFMVFGDPSLPVR